MQKALKPADLESAVERLLALEQRVTLLEAKVGVDASSSEFVEEQEPAVSSEDQSEELESELGLHWFARIGIVALAIGIAFLLTFPYEGLPPMAPVILGYFLVTALFVVSHFLQRSFAEISRYLMGGSFILSFFTTLRLSFFGAQPIMDRSSLFFILMLAMVTAFNMVIAIRRHSVSLFSFTLIMGYATALIANNEIAIVAACLVLALLSVYFHLRRGWRELLLVAPFLTYGTHLLWSLNNPLLGNTLQFTALSPANVCFLHLYVIVFAAGTLLRREKREDAFAIMSAVLNCALYYGTTAALTLAGTSDSSFLLHHALATLILLTLATEFWVREKSRYQTFFYAMAGYLALTVLILKEVNLPDAFTWLSMQSLLVLSTAIWFRSRFIVVANIFLYFVILFAYVAVVAKVNAIGLSFGIVALLSARIMNWQRERLELKTESMRNAYLGAAFLAFPYMLYRILPSQSVGLSWLGVAGLYYLLNILMQNQKYRWMGHLTLLLTVLYMLVIGIIALEPVYRIVSFLLLGVALLAASIIFTRERTKKMAQRKSGGGSDIRPAV